jgi:HicB family
MSARVTLRLSPDVHGELKRRARQQGQSLAAFIQHRLAAVVAQIAVGASNTPRRPDRHDIMKETV